MPKPTNHSLQILIVEGNTPDILAAAQTRGLQTAHERYQDALRLHARDAEFAVHAPYAADWNSWSGHPGDYDAFALTGSGVSWSASDERATPYLDTIAPLLRSGKPVIGSCWGLQTVMVVLGGQCSANPLGAENGLAGDLALTPAGRAHPVFAGYPDQFPSPCIHRDIVTELPQGAVLLASNAACVVQAAAYTADGIDFVGFQYHPELDLPHIVETINRREGSFEEESRLHWAPETDPELAGWAMDEDRRTLVFRNWLDHVRNVKTGKLPDSVA